LPPIVVTSTQGDEEEKPQRAEKPTGYNGNIVSVNEENNFVIIDLGEESGVKLGETLNVYRVQNTLRVWKSFRPKRYLCG